MPPSDASNSQSDSDGSRSYSSHRCILRRPPYCLPTHPSASLLPQSAAVTLSDAIPDKIATDEEPRRNIGQIRTAPVQQPNHVGLVVTASINTPPRSSNEPFVRPYHLADGSVPHDCSSAAEPHSTSVEASKSPPIVLVSRTELPDTTAQRNDWQDRQNGNCGTQEEPRAERAGNENVTSTDATTLDSRDTLAPVYSLSPRCESTFGRPYCSDNDYEEDDDESVSLPARLIWGTNCHWDSDDDRHATLHTRPIAHGAIAPENNVIVHPAPSDSVADQKSRSATFQHNVAATLPLTQTDPELHNVAQSGSKPLDGYNTEEVFLTIKEIDYPVGYSVHNNDKNNISERSPDAHHGVDENDDNFCNTTSRDEKESIASNNVWIPVRDEEGTVSSPYARPRASTDLAVAASFWRDWSSKGSSSPCTADARDAIQRYTVPQDSASRVSYYSNGSEAVGPNPCETVSSPSQPLASYKHLETAEDIAGEACTLENSLRIKTNGSSAEQCPTPLPVDSSTSSFFSRTSWATPPPKVFAHSSSSYPSYRTDTSTWRCRRFGTQQPFPVNPCGSVDDRKPTHFVALRIDDPVVVRNVYYFQKAILKKAPHLKPCVINPAKLHISLLILSLAQDEVPKAVNVISQAVAEFRCWSLASHLHSWQRSCTDSSGSTHTTNSPVTPRQRPRGVVLDFTVVGTFRTRVLFTTVPANQQRVLQALHEALVHKVQEAGLFVVGFQDTNGCPSAVQRRDRSGVRSPDLSSASLLRRSSPLHISMSPTDTKITSSSQPYLRHGTTVGFRDLHDRITYTPYAHLKPQRAGTFHGTTQRGMEQNSSQPYVMSQQASRSMEEMSHRLSISTPARDAGSQQLLSRTVSVCWSRAGSSEIWLDRQDEHSNSAAVSACGLLADGIHRTPSLNQTVLPKCAQEVTSTLEDMSGTDFQPHKRTQAAGQTQPVSVLHSCNPCVNAYRSAEMDYTLSVATQFPPYRSNHTVPIMESADPCAKKEVKDILHNASAIPSEAGGEQSARPQHHTVPVENKSLVTSHWYCRSASAGSRSYTPAEAANLSYSAYPKPELTTDKVASTNNERPTHHLTYQTATTRKPRSYTSPGQPEGAPCESRSPSYILPSFTCGATTPVAAVTPPLRGWHRVASMVQPHGHRSSFCPSMTEGRLACSPPTMTHSSSSGYRFTQLVTVRPSESARSSINSTGIEYRPPRGFPESGPWDGVETPTTAWGSSSIPAWSRFTARGGVHSPHPSGIFFPVNTAWTPRMSNTSAREMTPLASSIPSSSVAPVRPSLESATSYFEAQSNEAGDKNNVTLQTQYPSIDEENGCDDQASMSSKRLLALYDRSNCVGRVGSTGSFFPHMTIMKTSQGLRRIKNRRKKRMLKIHPEIFHQEAEMMASFGAQEVVAIDFLEMTRQDADGYYHRLATFSVALTPHNA